MTDLDFWIAVFEAAYGASALLLGVLGAVWLIAKGIEKWDKKK